MSTNNFLKLIAQVKCYFRAGLYMHLERHYTDKLLKYINTSNICIMYNHMIKNNKRIPISSLSMWMHQIRWQTNCIWNDIFNFAQIYINDIYMFKKRIVQESIEYMAIAYGQKDGILLIIIRIIFNKFKRASILLISFLYLILIFNILFLIKFLNTKFTK